MIKSKQQILQDTFGFDDFRPLQNAVVDKILNGEDVLLILPTGGGKSLCYQLPALMMDGVVVVISPLLALMQDQVHNLSTKGIGAEMISSMQDFSEIQQIEKDLQEGVLKIVFVAPERLQNVQFLQFLGTLKIAFFAVDEAHCVSEWGHEFRADYRQLGLLKSHFPSVGIAAFTATATTSVEKDIVKQLQFVQPDNIIRGKIYRDNLFIRVQARLGNGRQQLLDFLENHQNQQGIIYTLSRKNTETLTEFLKAQGIKACAYHAGLPKKDRHQAFSAFVNDEIEIMVATIAFGMGIDKSNIRFVIHMSLPKTIEAYYQEMGRAGRDGLRSEVLLLYSSADLGLLGRFIADIENEEYRNLAYQKLNLIKKYAFSESCRHQALSQYFNDVMPKCQTGCDNCLTPDLERSDISEQAKMFLSAVYRTNQCFGQTYIIDVLLGSKNKKVLNNQHQNLSVYGIGGKTNKASWKIIADRLLEIEALSVGEFNTLKLTEGARKILKSEQSVDMRSSNLPINNTTPKQVKQEEYSVDDEVFESLRSLRSKIAKEDNMPPYVIFDNKTLIEMAYFLPDNEEKFLKINGVGQVKFEKYGEQFLGLLSRLRSDDFNEPVIENSSSNENTQSKKIHPTYKQTLSLIEQDLSIKIMGHDNLSGSFLNISSKIL